MELIDKINKTLEILLNETNFSKEELIEVIKDNLNFKVNKEVDVNELIMDENIPKNLVIKFAFNLDEYLRTEK